MAEEQKTKSVEELLKQIDDFEKTVVGLSANVATLKKKLLDNRAKYGDDISKWPQDK